LNELATYETLPVTGCWRYMMKRHEQVPIGRFGVVCIQSDLSGIWNGCGSSLRRVMAQQNIAKCVSDRLPIDYTIVVRLAIRHSSASGRLLTPESFQLFCLSRGQQKQEAVL
jgi:hypothetical protein